MTNHTNESAAAQDTTGERAIEQTNPIASPASAAAHTDHGARHYDRTCPACAAESDTPRTDKAMRADNPVSMWVTPDFARQLERALNQESKAREELAEALRFANKGYVHELNRAERAEAELAALKVKHESAEAEITLRGKHG